MTPDPALCARLARTRSRRVQLESELQNLVARKQVLARDVEALRDLEEGLAAEVCVFGVVVLFGGAF